mmetsp:Transcript_15693/g.36811  ORF Transcript_15693/g.36811 Transcript_15693/m.36811 type:complete len:814 (-) Transcript_15693:31-2472(-)
MIAPRCVPPPKAAAHYQTRTSGTSALTLTPGEVAEWLNSVTRLVPADIAKDLKAEVVSSRITGKHFSAFLNDCLLDQLAVDNLSPMHIARMRKAWHGDFPDSMGVRADSMAGSLRRGRSFDTRSHNHESPQRKVTAEDPSQASRASSATKKRNGGGTSPAHQPGAQPTMADTVRLATAAGSRPANPAGGTEHQQQSATHSHPSSRRQHHPQQQSFSPTAGPAQAWPSPSAASRPRTVSPSPSSPQMLGLRSIPPSLVVLIVDRLTRSGGMDHKAVIEDLEDVVPEALFEELASVFGVTTSRTNTSSIAPGHVPPALLVLIVDRLARRTGMSHNDAMAELADVVPEHILEELAIVFGPAATPASNHRATSRSPPAETAPSAQRRQKSQEARAERQVSFKEEPDCIEHLPARNSPYENPQESAQSDSVGPLAPVGTPSLSSAKPRQRHGREVQDDDVRTHAWNFRDVVTSALKTPQEPKSWCWPAWARELQALCSPEELKLKASAGQLLLFAAFEQRSAPGAGCHNNSEFNARRKGLDTTNPVEDVEFEPPLPSSSEMKVDLDYNLHQLDQVEIAEPEPEMDFIPSVSSQRGLQSMPPPPVTRARSRDGYLVEREEHRPAIEGLATDPTSSAAGGSARRKAQVDRPAPHRTRSGGGHSARAPVSQPNGCRAGGLPPVAAAAGRAGSTKAVSAPTALPPPVPKSSEVQATAAPKGETGRSPQSVAGWVRELPSTHLPDAERETLAAAIEQQGINGNSFTSLVNNGAELAKLGVPSPAQAMKIRRAWEMVLREEICKRVASENLATASERKAVKMVF